MDYEVYRLGKREWLLYGSQGVGYLALLDFVFYRSAALFAVLAPMGICYPLILRKDLKRRRKEALKLQFKDAILSAASGLNAGYSVENAFAAALEEMDRLYGKDSMISQELRLILAKTRMNRAFGEALEDFARRSGLEDIQSFASVYATIEGKSSRADEIIRETQTVIADKMEIEMEIDTLMAAAKNEVNIMLFMPLVILLVIGYAGAGFMDAIYTEPVGRLVATGGLIVFLISYCLARKFSSVKI